MGADGTLIAYIFRMRICFTWVLAVLSRASRPLFFGYLGLAILPGQQR